MTAQYIWRPFASRYVYHSIPRFVRLYSSAQYENILVETPKPGVGLSTHNHFLRVPELYESLLIIAISQSNSTVLEP